MKALLFFCTIFLLTTISLSKDWLGADVPNPRIQPKPCGFETAGDICDPDELWSDEQHEELLDAQKQIWYWENKTAQLPNIEGWVDGKHQICDDPIVFKVVRVYNTSAPSAEIFAKNVADHWYAPNENGTICRNEIIIALVDSRSEIYVGKGRDVPLVLNKLRYEGVNNETIEHLNQGNFSGALVSTAKHAYELLLRDSDRIESETKYWIDWWHAWKPKLMIWVILIGACAVLYAIVCWIICCCCCKRKKLQDKDSEYPISVISDTIPIEVHKLTEPVTLPPITFPIATKTTLKKKTRSTLTNDVWIDSGSLCLSMSPSPEGSYFEGNQLGDDSKPVMHVPIYHFSQRGLGTYEPLEPFYSRRNRRKGSSQTESSVGEPCPSVNLPEEKSATRILDDNDVLQRMNSMGDGNNQKARYSTTPLSSSNRSLADSDDRQGARTPTPMSTFNRPSNRRDS